MTRENSKLRIISYLEDIAKQDNRCTRSPYVHVITGLKQDNYDLPEWGAFFKHEDAENFLRNTGYNTRNASIYLKHTYDEGQRAFFQHLFNFFSVEPKNCDYAHEMQGWGG